MASIKIILRKRADQDGTQPLVLQIIKDRKMSRINIGYSILSSDWDEKNQRVKKSHPNASRLNNYISKKLAEANGVAIELETEKKSVSVRQVKDKIKPKHGDTFFPQANVYLETLKAAGKYNRYTADKPRVARFKEFNRGEDIAFTDVTVGLLEKFKGYLKGGCNLTERTAMNHLVVIRSVFAQAKKDNIIDDKTYPFGKGKTTIKFPDTKKVGLNRDEVKRLESVDLQETYDHSRNLWLFSYNMAGMRISDVFRLTGDDIHDGRLHYIMNKNEKGDSLKIPSGALKILEKYPAKKGELIFPELKNTDLNDEFKVQRQIAFCTSRHDKYLRKHVAPAAGITKKLTMHIARHTFAQNATDIDARTLQKLFRHTKLETTVGYMGHFIHKDADDALEAVLK